MQGLTAKPRQDLTADEVEALLVGESITLATGLELLDETNTLVADISDALVDGEVAHNNYAEVHGTCTLQITRELNWGKARVRPYMTLSNEVTTARFNLGVYMCTSPAKPRGETPETYDVTGYDLLYLLQCTGPGDTYEVQSGVTYHNAVRAVLQAAGYTVPLKIDGTKAATQLDAAMVWAITEPAPTWLEIINDLLAAVGYQPIWVDQDGNYRSVPNAEPADRGVEWVFNTSNLYTNLIGEERTEEADVWGVPNWWRFVRNNMDTTPVEGAGIYTVSNDHGNSTSAAAVGRTIRKVAYLDVADQAALVAQGNRIVAEDKGTARRFTVQVEPLPVAGHMDVVRFKDGGESIKCVVASWTLPLDGSPGTWVLEAVA